MAGVNWDLRLLAYWIDHPEDTPKIMRIGRDFMLSHTARALYDFMAEYLRSYGQVPTMDSVHEAFPEYSHPPYRENLESITGELSKKKRGLTLEVMARDIITRLDTGNIDQAYEITQENYYQLQLSNTHQTIVEVTADDAHLLLADYEKANDVGGITGVPLYHDTLTNATSGMRPGNLIVLYGMPGSGKTWFGVLTMYWALMQGYNVLFWTREMYPKDILTRLASLVTHVDHRKLLRGSLDQNDFLRFRDITQNLRSYLQGQFVITNESDYKGRTSVTTLRMLIGKVRARMPVDLVITDGIHLLTDDTGGKMVKSVEFAKLTNVSQALKSLAIDTAIPVMGISHANRNAIGASGTNAMEDMAFTMSLVQDADVIVRVHLDKAKHEWYITVPKIRESIMDDGEVGFTANYNPCLDFEFKNPGIPEPFTLPPARGRKKAAQRREEDAADEVPEWK